MSVRIRLLGILEDNKGGFVSGGALAEELSVSRNAVWKAVESLRACGYKIEAVKSKGYRLEGSGDVLSAEGVMGRLRHEGVFRVETRKSVSSTNTVLRELAAKGLPEGYVIAAEGQTAGKGRLGRSFTSPAGHGAYFSLLLRPRCSSADAALITPAAAVAAARAIWDVFGVRAGIKWVNDLFVGGKKVCGILTEASIDMESGMIDNAVLGIGVNITLPEKGFSEELSGIAGALAGKRAGQDNERCGLIAATLDHFWDFYKDLPARAFLDEYRELSIVTGREVFVLSGESKRPARALAIDDDSGLLVQYENGDTEVLRSGEVSVKVI